MSLSITSPGPNVYSQEVFQLQNNLASLGYSVYMDGYFGPETQQAVKSFQSTWGNLTIDGIVGPNTQSAINEAVTLLLAGQWDQSMVQEYEPIIGGMAVVPPFLQTTTITTPTTPIAAQASILSGLGEIDWKWILIGVGIVMLVFESSKKRR